MISNGRRSFSDLQPSRLLVTLGLQRQIFTSGGATRAVHVTSTYIAGPSFYITAPMSDSANLGARHPGNFLHDTRINYLVSQIANRTVYGWPCTA